MKHILNYTLTSLALLLAALPCSAGAYVEDSVKVDGHMRQFVMYLPDGLQADAPLVFVLHGYGAGIRRENIMIGPADRHGFAVCIPQGLKDPQGEPSWNVGYAFQQGWKVDDVKALCSIARHVQKRYRLSTLNTFLTGMSNGGEMCYLMAYSEQYTFRAVAPIAGLTMAWTYEQMEAKRPIPLMEIHGTEDRVSEWTGDMGNQGGWGAYLPVPLAVGYWVAKNRCTSEETERVESLKGDEGHPVIKHCYSSPSTHCDVWLYEVEGGVHSWFTDDIDTGEEIWQFFSRYVVK
ncbi:MAG: esterase [Muribaculaceae bacterium]|nr:esterase [Muribaculaceae bacterium]